MQTFLPYKSFIKSAKTLDDKRLGRQRSEGKILVNSIVFGNGWSKHPASKMWYSYVEALKLYTNCIIKEWIEREKNNNMELYKIDYSNLAYPIWLGKKKFHSSHRSVLLFKYYSFYSQFGWKEDPKEKCWWPRKYFVTFKI
mgnify:CR=1 FL=1